MTNERHLDPPDDYYDFCEVCGLQEMECDCVECPECGEIGLMSCYDNEHMVMTDELKEVIAVQDEKLADQIEFERQLDLDLKEADEMIEEHQRIVADGVISFYPPKGGGS